MGRWIIKKGLERPPLCLGQREIPSCRAPRWLAREDLPSLGAAQHSNATASISTRAPLGRAATCTQALAGEVPAPKTSA